MKTICILTSVHPALDVRIYHKEAQSLAAAGYKVFLLNKEREGIDEFGVTFVRVDLPSGRLKRFLLAPKRMVKAAKATGAEIFHFHDPELCGAGKKLLKYGTVMYDVHEDVPKQILNKPWLPKWLRKISAFFFNRWEKKCAKKFTGIIAATSVIEDVFVKAGCKRIVTVNNYPKLAEFSHINTPWNHRPHTIGYVGAISAVRGLREMLDMLCDTDASLLLAGRFNDEALEREAMAHPCWDRVRYLGFLDRVGVANFLQDIRVGLIPLHPIPNYVESVPVKLFEYMAAGVPVVCSDFPFWRALLEGTGCAVFVNPMDSNAIARAINALLLNSEGSERMGLAGQKAVRERFHWGIEEQKLLDFYRLITAEGGLS